MPVNAGPEYFKAEEKYRDARTNEEKILALEEMIRTAPKHKGTENLLAQLKSKLAKLKKESMRRSKKGRSVAIKKEGEAQICLIGLPNSGKSTLLKNITNAKPKISTYLYTTKRPEIGMMKYCGVGVQIVEIPATFEPRYMSIARTSDLVVFLARNREEKADIRRIAENSFLRTKSIYVNPYESTPKVIKESIWSALDMMIVYTKTKHSTGKEKGTAMALPVGSTVREFAQRIHKDFVKNFRFARIIRNKRPIQAGLKYELKNNDIVELHMR